MPSPTRQWMRRTTRHCVDAAIALATASMTWRSAVAIVSAFVRARGCNSRSTESGLCVLFLCMVTTLFWTLLERPRKGMRRDPGAAAGPCSTAGAAGSCDRKRIVASSWRWRIMTNPCVMPFVYLVMSSLLKLTSKWPNASRAWETVTWLSGLTSSSANSRHHASTDLSDVRVSERPALTSQCFPSRRLDLNISKCVCIVFILMFWL